jgi:small-conductance mechanosensitive channel
MTARRSASRSVSSLLIVLGFVLIAASAGAQVAPPTQTDPAGPSAAPATPATLTIWNRPIVVFRVSVGQIAPAQRAAAAVRRFDAMPEDVRGEEVRALPAAVGHLQGISLVARDTILFGILEGDVDPTAGETLAQVSARARDQLSAAIEARVEQRRLGVVARGVGVSLGAATLLILILWAIRRAADRALLRLAEATHRRAVSVIGVDVRRPLEALERGLVRVTAWGLGLIAAYLWLTVSLQAFPYTRPWAAELRANLLGLLRDLGARALEAVPGVFAVVIIFLAARFVTRILDVFFQAVERDAVKLPGLQPDTVPATRYIATVVVWIFALTAAYEYIPGSSTDAFKAIGVLFGVMLSLGSAGLVNQLMSGLVVIYSRALKPGELVRVGELGGRVSEVGLLSTKLAVHGEEITIPNAVLVGTTVTNYSRLGGTSGPVVSTAITIGYDAAWRQVHALLQLAAERTPGLRRDPSPFVLQRALSDFYVEYELRAHLEPSAERPHVLSELHKQIQDAFNEFGVQIMSPAFEAQPDRPVVVPRARWFDAPAVSPKDGAAGKDAS